MEWVKNGLERVISMVEITFAELSSLYEQGQYEAYLQRLTELQDTDRQVLFPAEEQFYLRSQQIWALFLFARLDRVKTLLQEVKQQAAFQHSPLNEGGFLLLKVYYHLLAQQHKQGLKLLKQGENLFAALPTRKPTKKDARIAFFYWMKAEYASREYKFRQSIDSANFAKDMFHKLGHRYLEIYQIGLIGFAQALDGNIEASIHDFTLQLDQAELYGYPYISCWSLAALCAHYKLRRDLTQALDAGHKALTIWQSLQQQNPNIPAVWNNIELVSAIFNNLGLVYSAKGDFDTAMHYLEQGLSTSEAPVTIIEAERLTEIGKVYYQQGDLIRAKDYIQRGIGLYQSGLISFSEPYVPQSIFDLIRIAFEEKDLEQVKHYHGELKVFKSQAKSKIAKQLSDEYLQLVDALILKHGSRGMQKFTAQQQLTEFIKTDIVFDEIKSLAMVHLCELLLDEFRLYGEFAVFQEIQEIINELYELGQTHQVYPLIIQSLILKTQFEVWQGQLDTAIKYAGQAKVLA